LKPPTSEAGRKDWLYLSVGRDHFGDRFDFFGGSTRGNRHCFERTHRFDAVFTIEVAPSSGLSSGANESGNPTSSGIIDQQSRKAHAIAERSAACYSPHVRPGHVIRRDMAAMNQEYPHRQMVGCTRTISRFL
jgi:hypothetical protein